MQVQHENITHGALTGTHAEVPKGPRKKYGIVAVAVGKGLANLFKEFGVDVIVSGGQSMNPSTEDLVQAIQKVNADNVLVFPNNKNIILSAEQAVEIIDEQNVIVIPTATLAQGYSALSIMDLNPEPDAIKDVIMASIESVISGELTYAIRDSEYQGLKIHENDWMGILDGKIVTSTPAPDQSAKTLLEQILDQDREIVTIITGENTSPEEVDALQIWLEEHFPDVEVDVIEGGQPLYKYIFAIE
jgi:dihydroxyacetone kinase-like predicted kinase